MAVKVKHGGIMRQERERLLEISFGWQSGPALPSQRYLQERLLWLLFQQYPAMLFHGLPAWAGIGRACQHRQSGNLSRSSIGGQRGGRRERELQWLEKRNGTQFKKASLGSQDAVVLTWFLSSVSFPLQLPRSLCCANLQTAGRRNARARASTLRTEGRGTEKAR